MKFHLLSALAASATAETIIGVYVFSRHGDRTPKALPPANLTTLGYKQIYDSGTYYRDRYVSSNASSKISTLNSDQVKLSQIAVSAPQDNVLMNSAQGFAQALYPAIGNDASKQSLRNKTTVEAPLSGYQLIPISPVTSGTGSEDAAWLQGASNCANAQISSNNYVQSPEYKDLYNSSMSLYQNLYPTMNNTIAQSDMNFKNAYTIFDLLNVASIHNASFSPPPNFPTISSLAAIHELGLAYNTSSSVRAISGAVLAAEILTVLNNTITNPAKSPRLNIQFGAYATSLSFFGLAGLAQSDSAFTGIPDYASSMAVELFAADDGAMAPYDANALSVRFLFNNGSSAPSRDLTPFPLFGGSANEVAWSDFVSGMQKFAVQGQEQWCQVCGNSTGVCTSFSSSGGDADSKIQSHGGGSGVVSKPVAGVIGAVVALVVIALVEAAVLLGAGLRVVKIRRGAAGGMVENGKTG